MGNPAMMVDPWGVQDKSHEYAPGFVGPKSQPQEGDTWGSGPRGATFVDGGWQRNSPVLAQPVEVSTARWHDAAANGYDANMPEGTPVALYGFMSAIPDYRFHAGKLVPPQDYQLILHGAASDWRNQNYYWPAHGSMPDRNAPIREPEFDWDNVDEQTVEELGRAIGPRNGSITPFDNVWFIAGLATRGSVRLGVGGASAICKARRINSHVDISVLSDNY